VAHTTPAEQPAQQLDWSLLETILQLSPDAAIAVDGEGRIRAANRLVAELFGYHADELVGAGLETLIPERFRGAHVGHRTAYAAAPRARRMGAGLDLWGRRKDGSEFPVDISLAPVAAPSGPMVIAAVRDMTERRQEQAAQAQLAAIVESIDDAVIATTPEGEITSWNPGAERLLGYRADEASGRPVSMLVAGDEADDLTWARGRVLAGERLEPFETVRRRKDGTTVEVEVTLSAVRDRDGVLLGISGVMRDITERRRVQAELARVQREHEHFAMLADRERIARDLHDLVIQRIFAAGMSLQAILHQVEKEAVRTRVNEVMDELDATIAEIRTTIFELEQPHLGVGLRNRVLDAASAAARSLGFSPQVRFEGPVDSVVSEAIAEQVLTVVREALSNVARHAQARSASVTLVVDDAGLALEVVDDGVGMAGATRTSGLRNMRRRAEDLGGSQEVGAGPGGVGTRLCWRVPLSGR
jgi:two-component system sensor histidine kinase DevS